MFGSVILEVAIGLIFLFFLLSVAVSAACEFVELMTKARGQNLERGINNLLGDGSVADRQVLATFYNHPLISSLFRGSYRWRGHKLPSYIPASHFARAALDVADQLPQNSNLRQLLNEAEAMSGSERIRTVENLFDGAMERASGWYKRRTQVFVLLFALLLSFGANVNTFSITEALARNTTIREVIVAQAASNAENGAAVDVATTATQLSAVEVPWGWPEQRAGAPVHLSFWQWDQGHWSWVSWTLFGCLVTAFSISLGAPFWFDLLSRAVQLRTSLPERDPTPRRDGPPPTPHAAAEPHCGPGLDDDAPQHARGSTYIYG